MTIFENTVRSNELNLQVNKLTKELKGMDFDVTVYPVRAQGTTGGIQYDSTGTVTTKADTDVDLWTFNLYDYYPSLEGSLAYVKYKTSFELKAGTATADLKWRVKARNKDGTWTDMCAEQTESDIGTSYAAKNIEGYLDIKTNITTAPFEMKAVLQSNESNSTVSGTDIAFVDGSTGEDQITRSANDLVTAGFVAGDIVTVTGSSSNDGDYTAISVSSGAINVATASIAAESSGASVTLSSAGQAIGRTKNDTYIQAVGEIS